MLKFEVTVWFYKWLVVKLFLFLFKQIFVILCWFTIQMQIFLWSITYFNMLLSIFTTIYEYTTNESYCAVFYISFDWFFFCWFYYLLLYVLSLFFFLFLFFLYFRELLLCCCYLWLISFLFDLFFKSVILWSMIFRFGSLTCLFVLFFSDSLSFVLFCFLFFFLVCADFYYYY